ncbi:MAG: 23S rRNA pseudouridine(1911/1915/1917) synthase RluD [Methylococcales symbiont of Hymedesmia sp. n. MRB-2018]|nr:MAG: 23S rRNA pseudouridine(1911/1915/1917) synthase RluD [Methylococcales symbiont of Hymedesmia sp. n. MRB-2018]KAF3984139.1 MAG: 23S rRNA pseudouridine(1911/1915/1917) synthase RluD [Methylococcales symbiont of Hymedesmia sp. n. MRB-2018]
MAKLTAEIPDELAGMRLDQCLAEIFPDYSRSKLQIWIKAGRVTVDNKLLKGKDKIDGGEHVELNAETEQVLEYEAEDIPLDIVFEDESILIVNKPAGLVVHPAVGNWHGTLVNALLNHDTSLKTLPRAGIVHRLDKDTSGLLMVAKTITAHYSLSSQLQDRTITRQYLALVKGWMTTGGTVDAPLGRHPNDRTRHTVRDDGKHAVTHYRLEQRYKRHTLVRVKLETGRTHQIRVHMAYIHYPLVGDQVYGGRFQMLSHCSKIMEQALRDFKRQALHATRLGLQHPETDEYCEWQLPVPDDMALLLKTLEDEELD